METKTEYVTEDETRDDAEIQRAMFSIAYHFLKLQFRITDLFAQNAGATADDIRDIAVMSATVGDEIVKGLGKMQLALDNPPEMGYHDGDARKSASGS